MISLDEILNFTPTRLRSVRIAVQSQHPSVAELLTSTEPADQLLKNRVEAAAAESESAVRHLSWDLSVSEVRQVVRALASWQGLRSAIRIIALERPSPSHVALAWRSWEEAPTAAEVWEVTRELIEKHGISGPPFEGHETILGWASQQDPLPGLVEWLEGSAVLPSNLGPPPESPFRVDTPLIRRMEQGVLMHGSGSHLSAVPDWWILEGWTTLSPEDRMLACSNYLNRIEPSHWPSTHLEDIRGNYGMPGSRQVRNLDRFWELVPEELRRRFRRHFIQEDLNRAFAGDTDRHQYWSQWAERDQILDIVIGTARDTDWARMDFDGFSVLEVFESGNAAYFYTANQVRGMDWPRRVGSAGALKVKHAGISRFTDNRLIHAGSWQSKADSMIAAWARRHA